MSRESRLTAAVLLTLMRTVVFGGASSLFAAHRRPCLYREPTRWRMLQPDDRNPTESLEV